jgi:drug/metabolite transporter (DMT)-like permease
MANAPVDVIGFWRLLASAAVLLPFALKNGHLRAHFTRPKNEVLMVFLSALFFFMHLWTYFYSAQHTSIANCMIIFATNPLFVSAISYFVFGEKLTVRLALAYIFAAIGIYFLVRHSLDFEQGFLLGDLSALLSALFVAVYLVTGKKARMTIANSEYTFIAYSMTALFFGISGLTQGQKFTGYSGLTWLAICLSIAFPTFLGHVLFSYLMKRMNLNFMSCGKLLEPALSSLLAFYLFHEQLTNSHMWAFSFTTMAVLILFVPTGNLDFFKSKLVIPKFFKKP